MTLRCIKYVAVPQATGLFIPTVASFLTLTGDSNGRRPLSFHAVSFGEESSTSSLKRMAQIALEVQNDGANDPLLPAGANVPSSYTEALDTVSRPKILLVS